MHSLWRIAFVCLGAFFLVEMLKLLRRTLRMHRLPPPTASLDSPPFVSVILAARDEADRLSNTLEHLFAQRGIDLEVIVVNDRSRDATRQILDTWASREPRLKAIHVQELPPGWLGKCHACYLGANQASAPWILFTDADCWLSPDVILRAWQAAMAEKADHVTLTPGVSPQTVPAQAWHLAFLLGLANWFEAVNQDRPKLHLGMGAFNFVRREAYEKCGGYQALRLTVIDDIRLGRLLRKTGFRTRAFVGGPDTECHWGVTARSMIRIMEKNYFAALDYKVPPVILLGCFAATMWPLAFGAWLTLSWPGIFLTVSLCSWCIPARVLSRKLGWGWAGALFVPLIYPLVFYSILNSAWVTLRQGGVRWRDTFYSLEELRAHTVRLQ